jgi:PAS domain S-box-containing protein
MLSCVAALTVTLLAPSAGLGGEPPQKVLIFYSEDVNIPANVIVGQAIRSTLSNGYHGSLQIFSEALENFRIPNEKYEAELLTFLQRKYEGEKIDLIIPCGEPALRFLLKYRDRLFSGTPIVFMVLGEGRLTGMGSNITGVWGKLELSPTLVVALTLHPDTQRVVVVSGKGSLDKYMGAQARKEFAPYEGRVQFTYLTDVTFSELRQALASLQPRTIVIYLAFSVDAEGRFHNAPEQLALVAPSANAPIYVVMETYFIEGVVGGRFLSFDSLGKSAGELGLSILGGQRPDDIPPKAVAGVTAFDWRQLKRWGISEKRLPPGAEVRYKEVTLWDQYKWRIVGIISLCLIQTILIVTLLAHRARRRHAEAEKARTVSLLQATLESTWDGILVVDRVGKVLSYNQKLLTVWGLPEIPVTTGDHNELLASVQHNVKDPMDLIECSRAIQDRPDVVSHDFLYYHDGRIVERYSQPFSIAGRNAGRAWSFRDITERRRAESALQNAHTELAHISRVNTMGELAASIAHEVNQPLTAVITYGDLCLDWVTEGKSNGNSLRQALSEMVKDARRASEVIARIRTLLRKSPPTQTQLSINEVIREVCALVRSELVSKRVELHTTLEDNLPAVTGDRVQLQQVLLNLIRNGVEAMIGDDEWPQELTITSSQSSGAVMVEVRDLGPGLAPSELEHIFKPFFSTKSGGMGMGLAISRTILDDHKGRLWAEPNPGRGLSLRFTLPAYQEGGDAE